jgi:hypothetical protein
MKRFLLEEITHGIVDLLEGIWESFVIKACLLYVLFLSAQNLKQQYVICGDLGKSVNTRSLMGIFEIFLLLFLHIFNYGNTKDQTFFKVWLLKPP